MKELKFDIGEEVSYLHGDKHYRSVVCTYCKGEGFYIDKEGFKCHCSKTKLEAYKIWIPVKLTVSKVQITKYCVTYLWERYYCGEEDITQFDESEIFTQEEAQKICDQLNQEEKDRMRKFTIVE